mgnify:CR=1 FL=1
MIQFKHDSVMKRYNVLVPYVLAGEQDMVTVASISENKEPKVTLHRDVSLKLLKQIILMWDEKEHMDRMQADRDAGEFDKYFDDIPKPKKKGNK